MMFNLFKKKKELVKQKELYNVSIHFSNNTRGINKLNIFMHDVNKNIKIINEDILTVNQFTNRIDISFHGNVINKFIINEIYKKHFNGYNFLSDSKLKDINIFMRKYKINKIKNNV